LYSEFEFDYLPDGEKEVIFGVWDEDVDADDHIGTGKVEDVTLFVNRREHRTIELTDDKKNKQTGTIEADIWIGTAVEQEPAQPAPPADGYFL
jgi:hypothetical protein